MLCPNCKKELIVIERDSAELDYCLFCKGFWFDNLEWDLFCEKLSIRDGTPVGDLYQIPKAIVKEKNKKCPICNKPMEKFLFFDTILDRCPSKCGIWFDENEISRVFNSLTPEKKSPIMFLGQLLYKK